MFRIGDFSKIARVSAGLLRFYDEIGLFTPAHADPQTGYRYYTVAQLAQLNRILVLKDLGFNLDQVRDILSSNVSAAKLRNMLLLRRNDVEQTLSVESQRLHHIETRIAQLESEGTLSADDVVVRSEPMRQLLSLRRIVPSFSAARELILELRTHARPLLPKGRPSTLIAIAHSPQFEQDEIDVEFGYVLEDGFNVSPPEEGPVLTLRELGSVERMAVCVRVGLPEDAHLVTAKIGRFVEASGDTLAGPSREVFLQPPNLDRMHEAVIEMQFPIQPRPTVQAEAPNDLS
jgi:DNA-binding transcriptional MerR regulator